MPPRELPLTEYPALTDYGLLGDGLSAALVSSEGSVDWWCPARFDAPSVLARLLDSRIGGHFAIGLPTPHKRSFGYMRDTNVLCSHFETAAVKVTLTTLMPHTSARHPGGPRCIVRLLECFSGEADATVDLKPAFDYARAGAEVRAVDGGVVATGPGERLVLASTVPLEAAADRSLTTFRLQEGDRHGFVLSYGEDERARYDDGLLEEVDQDLLREVAYWREWASRCRYDGPERALVVRSLLALKLLQYEPTGAFVAAPTCSIPEAPQQNRNWDYRYAWLRDGVFIGMALETAGYFDEAKRFKAWAASVARRDAPDRLQMLYRVDGERDLRESVLDHLEGYRRSSPVRIGNGAVEQHQLDTYGEFLTCFPLAEELFRGEAGDANWAAVRSIVEHVCAEWHEPDSGMWELRGRERHFVYSKAMAWAAIDHGLRAAENHGLDAPVEEWEDMRRRIHEHVLDHGFDPVFGGFTQTVDSAASDASNLLLPILGFLDVDDPRVRMTIDRIERDLSSHGLLHRYITDDSLDGNEGAFLVASFWMAENLANLGEINRAWAHFERAAHVAGPAGLLPEQADPVTGTPLGNYPQALSHLGLVLAAFALWKAPAREGEKAFGRSVALMSR